MKCKELFYFFLLKLSVFALDLINYIGKLLTSILLAARVPIGIIWILYRNKGLEKEHKYIIKLLKKERDLSPLLDYCKDKKIRFRMESERKKDYITWGFLSPYQYRKTDLNDGDFFLLPFGIKILNYLFNKLSLMGKHPYISVQFDFKKKHIEPTNLQEKITFLAHELGHLKIDKLSFKNTCPARKNCFMKEFLADMAASIILKDCKYKMADKVSSLIEISLIQCQECIDDPDCACAIEEILKGVEDFNLEDKVLRINLPSKPE